MKRFNFLVFCMLMLPCRGLAATYSLPSDAGSSGAFSSCSLSGSTVTCNSNLTLASDDVIELTQDITLVTNATLTIGQDARINIANIYTLNINASGSINSANTQGITAYANLTSTQNVNFGNSLTWVGNIQSDSGINLKNNAIVTGNLTATDTINIDTDAQINGNIESTDDKINIGNDSEITGNITSDDNTNIGTNAVISGNINSSNKVNIKSGADITGDINAVGNLQIGNNSTVIGSCTAASGNYPTYCSGNAQLAYFAFDENVWTAGAASIENLLNSTLKAVPVGSTTQNAGYTCKGATVADNNNQAAQNYIDTQFDVDSDIGDAGTVMFWLKLEENWGDAERVLIDASDGTNEFKLSIQTNNNLKFSAKIGNNLTSINTGIPGSKPSGGEWAHIAFGWDRSTNTITFKVNDNFSSSPNFYISLSGLETLVLGDNRASITPFTSANATFDEVRIFNKLLSDSDMSAYAAITQPTCSTTVTLPDPVIEYRFDELEWDGNTDEVRDSSGNSNHAVADFASNTNTTSDGKMCRAANFAGSGQHLDTPTLTTLESTSSLSFWIKTTQRASNTRSWSAPGITGVEQSGDSKDIFWGWISDQGKIGLAQGNDDDNYSNTVISDDSYHHVVLTFDENTREVTIYIDGKLDKIPPTKTNSGPINFSFNQIGYFRRTNGSTPNYLDAIIDEFIVFDEILDADQAKKIYDLQEAGKNLDGSLRNCTPPPPTVCFSDDFQRLDLGNDWALFSGSGSFGMPRIVNNRLRLTDATGNNATGATLFRLFPSAGNRMILEFDYYAYGGGGADGIALVFSDSSQTPQPGYFGGSLGYSPWGSNPGFAGGWMAVGLDEYGNFLVVPNNGLSSRVPNTVTLRGSGAGTTGYNYITSNGQLPGSRVTPSSLNPTVQNSSGHRYRISIDHENGSNAYVTVERDTGSGFITLIDTLDLLAQTGQAAIPENLYLTITGSTGAVTNIHEIDNLEVCANSINSAEAINHYELDRNLVVGLTCEALNISARACLNDDCSSQLAGPITTTFAPANGWANGATQSNYTSGQSFSFQLTTPSTETFDIVASTPNLRPLVTEPLKCFVAGIEQANCSVSFVDSSFRFFSNTSPNTSIANYAMTAGQNLSDLRLKAIVNDEATGECRTFLTDPSWGDSQIGTRCLNPGSCAIGEQVTWTQSATTTLANNENLDSGANLSSIPISYDANGVAQFSLNASDIGLQQLIVNSPLLPDADGNATTERISGSVNLLVSPANLRIINVTNAATSNNGVSAFAKAGEQFQLELQALDANNNPTRSFGRVSGLYDIDWSQSTVNTPTGATMGSLTGDAIGESSSSQWQAVDKDSDGNAETLAFSIGQGLTYGEVGNINLTARIENFLGFGSDLISSSVNVGRFIPAYFSVSEVAANTAAWGTDSSQYQGQSDALTGLSFDLTAFDINNNPLQNYVASSQQFPVLADATNSNAIAKPTGNNSSGNSFSQTGASLSSGNFSWTIDDDINNDTNPYNDAMRLTADVPNLEWQRKLSAPNRNDTLQNIANLQLLASALTDKDNVCVQSDYAAATCLDVTIDIANRDLYYGRLSLPEQVDGGSQVAYLPTTVDYLASFDLNNEPIFALQSTENNAPVSGLDFLTESQCSLTSCPSVGALAGVSFSGPNGTGTNFIAGTGLFEYDLGSEDAGIIEVFANMPDWLNWDWDNDGTFEPPSSYILFGEYQGRSPILFVRPGFR